MRPPSSFTTGQLVLTLTASSLAFAACDLNAGEIRYGVPYLTARTDTTSPGHCPHFTFYGLPAVERVKNTISIDTLSDVSTTSSSNDDNLQRVYYFDSAASFPGCGFGTQYVFPTRSQVRIVEGMSLCVFGENSDWVSVQCNIETVALPAQMNLQFQVWLPQRSVVQLQDHTQLAAGDIVYEFSEKSASEKRTGKYKYHRDSKERTQKLSISADALEALGGIFGKRDNSSGSPENGKAEPKEKSSKSEGSKPGQNGNSKDGKPRDTGSNRHLCCEKCGTPLPHKKKSKQPKLCPKCSNQHHNQGDDGNKDCQCPKCKSKNTRGVSTERDRNDELSNSIETHMNGFVKVVTITLPAIRFRPTQTEISNGESLLWNVRTEGRSPTLAHLLAVAGDRLVITRVGTVEVGRRRLSGLR